MKKIKKMIIVLLTFTLLSNLISFTNKSDISPVKQVAAASNLYANHGKLKVKGTHLIDNKGKIFQLKGVSSHGINWDVGYPFVNESALKSLRDNWGVNCFRVAMYTEDYNGYCVTDKAGRNKLLKTIDNAVKAGKKLGMYVIIDWHILNDGSPAKHQKQAKSFFKKIAKKYKKYGNVLYEICNEPNGGTTWGSIKKYAKKIIKTIRKYSKKSIIIVGTPTWSQDVDIAAASKLKGYKNIMYSLHFYAATHKDDIRNKLKTAVNKGLPVFCSEFSICDASGNGNNDYKSASEWLNLLDSYNISYVTWSLSNKNEAASLLKSGLSKTGNFSENDLSSTGKWLMKRYKKG